MALPWRVQNLFYIACAMKNVNNVHAVALRLIENKPVLEVLHRPAAKAARGGFAKTTENAHSRHVGQGLKAAHEMVKKTLCGVQSRLFFEIVKMGVDFAPCEGTHGEQRHGLRLG